MIENCGAADVQLTRSDLHEIETALTQVQAHGDRYPEIHMRLINR